MQSYAAGFWNVCVFCVHVLVARQRRQNPTHLKGIKERQKLNFFCYGESAFTSLFLPLSDPHARDTASTSCTPADQAQKSLSIKHVTTEVFVKIP